MWSQTPSTHRINEVVRRDGKYTVSVRGVYPLKEFPQVSPWWQSKAKMIRPIQRTILRRVLFQCLRWRSFPGPSSEWAHLSLSLQSLALAKSRNNDCLPITRKFHGRLHHFEHLRDELLQYFCLSLTFSSATLSAKGRMHCNRSKWSNSTCPY